MNDTDNPSKPAPESTWTEPTNADRARWARNALATFTTETFSGEDPDTMDRNDLECAIGDLICDLLHLAQHKGFAVEPLWERALAHFQYEVQHDD